MKNTKVQKMVAISLFSAMGLILQYVGFPVIPAFGFMKVDFSDIPVLLSMFLYGPLAGVITALVRSVLHLLTTGAADPTNIVGDVASFFATTTFVLPMYYFFQVRKQLAFHKAYGVITGIIAMTVFMSLANYFVITPMYLYFFNATATNFLGMSLAKYVAIGVVPFNLIKASLVSVVFLALYAKLLPWLSKKQIGTIQYRQYSK